MKLEELFEYEDGIEISPGKVERAPKQKDKSKFASRMIRLKSDRI